MASVRSTSNRSKIRNRAIYCWVPKPAAYRLHQDDFVSR